MRVLIVDDNKGITQSLEKYLTIKGHDVVTCNDGYDGLTLIQNGRWDKILLDLSMPLVSGFDIIASLENYDELKDKKIVIFTASNVSESIIAKLGEKKGVQGLLKKPLSIGNLEEVLVA